mgnify:CR=1 FL=1
MKIGDIVKYFWGKETRTGTIVAYDEKNDEYEVTVSGSLHAFFTSNEIWPANDAYGHPWSK